MTTVSSRCTCAPRLKNTKENGNVVNSNKKKFHRYRDEKGQKNTRNSPIPVFRQMYLYLYIMSVEIQEWMKSIIIPSVFMDYMNG